MKITFFGHSSLGIEVSGKHVLIDPYISANPNASHININELEADYILLTHAHSDHILDVSGVPEVRAVSHLAKQPTHLFLHTIADSAPTLVQQTSGNFHEFIDRIVGKFDDVRQA